MTDDRPPLFIGSTVEPPSRRRELARVEVKWADGHQPKQPDTWAPGPTLIPPLVGHNDNREED